MFVAARTEDPEKAHYTEEDIQVPVRDGSTITVRLHKPKVPPSDGSPVFVMLHGGGYAIGGLDNETLLCRRWTKLGGIAVNVDYRLAPEHPFPTGVHDAYDALKWVCLRRKSSDLALIRTDSFKSREVRWQPFERLLPWRH